MRSLLPCAALICALGAFPLRAAPTAPSITYVQASNADLPCKIGRPNVKSGETVFWRGPCANGFAEGKGVAAWHVNGKESLRYEGTFVRGLLEGKGTMIAAEGDRYDGEYKGGLREGHGVYVSGDGTRFEGEYVNNQRTTASAASSPPPAESSERTLAHTAPGAASSAKVAATPSAPAGTARTGDPLPGKLGVEQTTTRGNVYRVDACGGWPEVVGKLPSGLDLRTTGKSGSHRAKEEDPVVASLNEAIDVLVASCRLNRNNSPTIFLFTDRLPPAGTKLRSDDKNIPVVATRIGSSLGSDWHVDNHVMNAFLVAQAAQKAETERTTQLAAKAERDKKVAERESANKAQFEQFVKKHHLLEKEVKGLSANPFAFEGQSVLLITQFEQMQSATSGLFVSSEGPIIVSDIPKGTFLTKANVLLAAKVLGNTKFDGVVEGLVPVNGMVPSVKYLGALICIDNGCKEK